MSTRDEAINRLYRLPRTEFTAARNALAKSLGKDGARVRRLEKPVLAAWAVNQIYWRRRNVYDRLIRAAERLRAAHGRLLSGRRVDLDPLDAAHRDAVRAAAHNVRAILSQSGEVVSGAVLNAIADTLQALPAGDPGRLTRPLRPAGFEALAGLVAGGRRLRLVTPPQAAPAPASRPQPRGPADRKREAAAKKRAALARRRALKTARTAERRARAAIDTARRALARAERNRARLRDQLQFAEKRVLDLEADVRQREQTLATALNEIRRIGTT